MSVSLSQRVQQRVESHGEVEEIEQLCLDNLIIFKLDLDSSSLISRCLKIQYLTMNHCRLTTLQCLPFLPNLIAFEAIGNKVKDNDLANISMQFPKLLAIGLDQNLIENVGSFALLGDMEHLEHIEIQGNPVNQVDKYRSQIFQILPMLRMIDSHDVFGDPNAIFDQDTDSEQSDDEGTSIDEENSPEQGMLAQKQKQETLEEEKSDEEIDIEEQEGHPRKYRQL